MQGHVARKRDRYYAVIYEGLDPVTGKERRTWHPAGTDRAEAERLATRLAAERDGRNDEVRSLTFGAYLTGHWLPAKRRSPGDQHLPRLRPQDPAPHPARARPQAAPPPPPRRPRTALRLDAAPHRRRPGPCPQDRLRGAPRHPRRARPRRTPRTGDPQRRPRRNRPQAAVDPEGRAAGLDRRTNSRRSCGPRPDTACSPPCGSPPIPACAAASCSASTGATSTRKHARLSINRGLVAVGYELHETRGKTRNSRRSIDLDATTLAVLAGWRALQAAEYHAIGIDDPGWMFTDADGEPVHPHSLSQAFERIARRAGVPVIRLHDLRHTARHPAHRPRHPRQGRVRTTRPRQVDLHHRDLPARPPRHASRSRPHLREPHRTRHRTHHSATPESRLNTRENTTRTR